MYVTYLTASEAHIKRSCGFKNEVGTFTGKNTEKADQSEINEKKTEKLDL